MIAYKHSGHAGDIIYSIPAMIAHAKPHPRFKLYLKLFEATEGHVYATHPLGRFMLNDDFYQSLKSLLEKQDYMEEVSIYDQQPLDIDLDRFRTIHFPIDGNIARWYEAICPVQLDLYHPWLHVEKVSDWQNSIIAARSFRYRNEQINYQLLNLYNQVGFVGTVDEYKDFQLLVPHAKYIKTENFYELAVVINSAKFFIGNQSAPFAIAEGLKVPRILEACPGVPNVIPFNGGYAACNQNHFAQLIENFISCRPLH